jgi:gluconokinase
MEGVVYSFLSVFRAVEEVSEGIESVRVSGGFVHSPTWMQITADVYGRELIVPAVTEATSLGAMFMVMLALGLARRMEDVHSLLPDQQLVRPDPRAHDAYRELFSKYNRLYEKLKDEFSAIPNVGG